MPKKNSGGSQYQSTELSGLVYVEKRKAKNKPVSEDRESSEKGVLMTIGSKSKIHNNTGGREKGNCQSGLHKDGLSLLEKTLGSNRCNTRRKIFKQKLVAPAHSSNEIS